MEEEDPEEEEELSEEEDPSVLEVPSALLWNILQKVYLLMNLLAMIRPG